MGIILKFFLNCTFCTLLAHIHAKDTNFTFGTHTHTHNTDTYRHTWASFSHFALFYIWHHRHTQIHKHIHTCADTPAHTDTHRHMHTDTNKCTCRHTQVYAYLFTYTNRYTHAHRCKKSKENVAPNPLLSHLLLVTSNRKLKEI